MKEVTEPGSILQWEFFSIDYDISFELSVTRSEATGNTQKQKRQIIVRTIIRLIEVMIPRVILFYSVLHLVLRVICFLRVASTSVS